MVTSRALFVVVSLAALAGCSLVNAPSAHTRGRDLDAGLSLADAASPDATSPDARTVDALAIDANAIDAMGDPSPDAFTPDAFAPDAGPDTGPDAPLPPPPRVRVAHLARETGALDVYVGDTLVASSLDFAELSASASDVVDGTLTVRVTRAGSAIPILEETFGAERGREYTLAIYGDERTTLPPPLDGRVLDLLWLDDDASGLDTRTDIRLAAVHVASPVVAGQLVAVRPVEGNLLLADSFAFRAVAPLTLRSAAYVIGFDAGADSTIDLDFAVPALSPGTYANVFVAARPDGSVFLFVTRQDGPAIVIDPIREPSVRIAHVARDSGLVDIYANGALVASSAAVATVTAPFEVDDGMVTFRVTRAGSSDVLVARTFVAERDREYTLTFYGDQTSLAPPLDGRLLDLLWIDTDDSGLDPTTQIRLVAIHVASPVVEGQLVAVVRPPDPNVLLVDAFGFRAIAPLTLASMPYTVGFDAGGEGVVDLEFDIPPLVPGTYANVFVAARDDDSVYLLVNTGRGGTLIIDPNP